MNSIPILDNHMHIDLRGRGMNAVKDFRNAGGTHIILVSKPSWTLGIHIRQPPDYVKIFDETINIAHQATEMGIKAFPVLGVHPAEITQLTTRMELDEAVETMKGGLDIASGYVKQGSAVGIKSGRPHYPVSEYIWDASNEIMEHAFQIAADLDCAVQLHTESVGEEQLTDIAARAKECGTNLHRVVKHFSPPLIEICNDKGIFPSVIASKNSIETAIAQGDRFMMETDYIDDPERPGAVLGPKTVPRRTLKLVEKHGEDIFWKIHKENPEKVYDIQIEL
ncbi:TatD-related deoxyribonuclease [Methanosalsum zhilinae DSM 4017]|uniref:TatD-related deoxyribonuclease n=1 Tax=Methanosalsum zhilinae (strain DSM 4017 / NBRC 107636 / OCM 62 / WeN5) TaxID=679901 RepID=F7XQJ8_METZD|nr:TatD family hydrolase [Methanosalsum zhilinae]AEH60500.1 TatD-related deoxyribonuclease [Methanosalsum zhilinae DSM 4017]